MYRPEAVWYVAGAIALVGILIVMNLPGEDEQQRQQREEEDEASKEIWSTPEPTEPTSGHATASSASYEP